jgi:hypothetical protein
MPLSKKKSFLNDMYCIIPSFVENKKGEAEVWWPCNASTQEAEAGGSRV